MEGGCPKNFLAEVVAKTYDVDGTHGFCRVIARRGQLVETAGHREWPGFGGGHAGDAVAIQSRENRRI